MAIPHKERLATLHAICLQIFRQIAQKSLAIRQYACGIFRQSDEKFDDASVAQSVCGIAIYKKIRLKCFLQADFCCFKETLQADCVQSRQAGFIQCFLNKRRLWCRFQMPVL